MTKICAVAASLLALASCSNKVEFVRSAFVSSDVKALEVGENAGKISIGISAYNITSPTTVTFSIAGTAQAGTDYRLASGADGVLTFTESGTQNIEFDIIDRGIELQGDRTILLALTSVSEGVDLGAITYCTVTISDVVIIDWNFLEGTWTATDYYESGDRTEDDPYEVEIKKVDDTTCELYNLWNGEMTLTGTVDFETKTIKFDPKQTVWDASAYGYGNLWLIGYEGGWGYNPVYATMSGAGVSLRNWGLLITDGQYAGYVWDDPYRTQMKKNN